jgi:hypothetical protein
MTELSHTANLSQQDMPPHYFTESIDIKSVAGAAINGPEQNAIQGGGGRGGWEWASGQQGPGAIGTRR